MAEDWSQPEVEIIIEDYLTMLVMELRGSGYNKAERNRELQKLLPSRSRGSIEFKHQNISAVMIEIGYPYVEGYKPRANFQGLLQELVERRVFAMPQLAITVANLVQQPAEKPARIDDILGILVAPPPPPKKKEALYEERGVPKTLAKRNYLEEEARNHSLGRAGEALVLEYEHQRLWRAGHKSLADRIDQVSNRGDGHGFDILSFELDGRERLIEVKTTRFGAMNPFFVSSNEVAVSERRSSEYCIYRLFDFSRNPRLFMLTGSVRNSCSLEAVQFRASPGTETN